MEALLVLLFLAVIAGGAVVFVRSRKKESAANPAAPPAALARVQEPIGGVDVRALKVGDVDNYHVDVPSFGDWGFLLASADRFPALTLAPPPGRPLRFLDRPTLSAAASFPPDRARIALKPSTLNRPRLLDYQRRGYRGY